jgi:hypothetical protein
MHSHFKRVGIDYRYRDRRSGEVLKTRYGADKHWELESCLDDPSCALDLVTKANLKFLIAIRHEIEHQMTHRIGPHSHSIVPGGFDVTSYTTRLTPFTSLMIRVAVSPKNFISKG